MLALMDTEVRVVIIDDHPVFADSLAMRLGAEPDVRVVETARTNAVGIASIDLRDPDVAIIDIEVGEESGIDLVEYVRARAPRTRVVIVTAHDDAETAIRVARAGASALVPKDAPSDHLVSVMRGVMLGESHFPPHLLTDILEHFRGTADQHSQTRDRLSQLSDRELEILQLVVDGLDRAAIASRLFLSVNTVRTHTKNIFAKIDVHSSLEAVSVALQAGMRPSDSGRPTEP